MQKDLVWHAKPANGAPSILIGDDDYHSKGRRVLSHAFSEKALAYQEPRLLVERLREIKAKIGEAQDMTKWYNWTTFDVIADLIFGEPFASFKTLQHTRMMTHRTTRWARSRISYIFNNYPWSNSVIQRLIPGDSTRKRKDFQGWVHTQVRKRIERGTQRPAFMTQILANNGARDFALSDERIDSNANLMLVAGSETTATLLSGVTYCLLVRPDKHEKLVQDIRGRFEEYSDITLAAANEYPYLIAGTAVSVSHYPAYHSETNFKDADDYIPEGSVPDQAKYAEDERSAWQPFSFGPRNCLGKNWGKNLAYAEMRLVLAKVL
ncbi:hypothetical protein DOTSEDRAFT_49381 [Dothistroma septosporum NZE10]|uniref:Uncharacterized protein n=1 Tax=Dothistroma septosporum (strain NZE10 / CBS 128990) TaxID=675120 RepID=N1Q1A7_DOTSN|nr:hypothetical protein DOTSEDRAFT_49381 [Dothistroma septosporum NZE10]